MSKLKFRRISKKQLSRSITTHIFVRFLITLIVFSVALALLFVIAVVIGSSVTWYNVTIYNFLRAILDRAFLLYLFFWLIGFFVILFYYWRKTMGYIEDITNASYRITSPNEELIMLPAELKPVEDQLNQIKFDMLRNQRAAKEAEQRKNDLIVYLAHDLKTPLTSVLGYLTLLKDEREISEETQTKYLNVAYDKAVRLEELINEFFEITRFNLSNIILEQGPVNLARLLEQLTYEFVPMLKPKSLQYDLRMEGELTLTGDSDKLGRVFDNLMRNAISYSYENSTILITAKREAEQLHICFINDGNTIPPQKLIRIFDQFYRLDTSRTTKSGGAGLGLAIAKEIIELHHGTISAESEGNKIILKVILPAS